MKHFFAILLLALSGCTKSDSTGTDSEAQSNESVRCIEVNIETLFENALEYQGQKICTTGQIDEDEPGIAHGLMALAVLGASIEQIDNESIDLIDYRSILWEMGASHGSRVRASGVFRVSEGCYRDFHGLVGPDERWMCVPVAVPMDLEGATFSIADD